MTRDLLSALDGKWDAGNRPADLFSKHVAKHPAAYLDQLLEGLESKKRRVQSGCAELASLIAEQSPAVLYPHLSRFAAQLEAKEPVLRWEAACTLGNLARVDDEAALPRLVPRIAEGLSHESIVLQGHAARALAKIARAHPAQARRIFEALTGSTHFFPGSRVGYLVEAMEAFGGIPAMRPEVEAFVTPYASSEYAPVARKAKRVLKLLHP